MRDAAGDPRFESSVRPDAHAASAAVAASGDSPGFSRPTTSMAISSSRPAEVVAELPGEREWRPIVGRTDAEARESRRA